MQLELSVQYLPIADRERARTRVKVRQPAPVMSDAPLASMEKRFRRCGRLSCFSLK
jgi:hypothetical protein